ncbi:MAG: hypothetical protein KY454_03370 [Actinobacteria bacterium]|nr:hypothetical protein [Actinomycetota bacterium]MBW3649101.1 hypothetical protein [Actinomycetota bacterium]
MPDPALRQSLLKAKLKALVRARWGDAVDQAHEGFLPGGAALRADGSAWVLAEDEPQRCLGAALAWAGRNGNGATELHLLASGGAPTLARRAALFDRSVRIYGIEGTTIHEAQPEPLSPQPALDPRAEALRPMLEEVGAECVVEEGILRAEVLGLEVARVEVGPEGAQLAVGVGKHDREAQREVRGEHQGPDELFEVVRLVAEHRVPTGFGHAAYHLAPERWLRAVVTRTPELVGARQLSAVPPPIPRQDLRQLAPAPAAGVGLEGEPLLVVCSVGIDVDLVPAGADAWLADGREPRLVFCVPEGDDHPVTRELAEDLVMPAEVVTVPEGWRGL